MSEKELVRNTAVGFARRTMVNVEAMMELHRHGKQIHPVTHLTNSLLGLVVFLHEKAADPALGVLDASRLGDVWPDWRRGIEPGQTNDLRNEPTLREFVTRVRHAVAHGNVWFDSDLSDLDAVTLKFDSRKDVRQNGKRTGERRTVWLITMRARELEMTCRGICQLL